MEVGHLWIRAPNWVGDLVMATRVLGGAVACERFERVSIALRKPLLDLLADGPLAKVCVPLESRREEVAALRAARPDAALLLTNSFGAALRAFRARVPVRVGAALSGRGPLLTHPVRPPEREGRRLPFPTQELQLALARPLGIPCLARPALSLQPEARLKAQALLREAGLAEGEPYVLCTPAAAFGAAKAWPPAFHARVLDALHARRGLRGVLCGAPGEEGVLRAVATAARHPVVDLSERARGLTELKGWVAGASLVLTSDSGPRWVAAAFGVPCVCVMGPNFPELTPPAPRSVVLRVRDLECSPCVRRRCPLGHHRCMQWLDPERVLASALRLLDACSGGPTPSP